MSFQVSFYKEGTLYHNVKYRNSYPTAPEWSGEVVDIGNFSNKNLYQDNSVEVACDSYSQITDCNVIKIEWDGKKVIGFITDWEYINDNNTRVHYSVDAFTSARSSGMIDEMTGLCERTILYPDSMLVNDQPEPFAPSDVGVVNSALTASLNEFVKEFEGVQISADGTQAGGTCFILTVSEVVDAYCGYLGPWVTDPTVTTKVLTPRADLSFFGAGTTKHSGGVFVGVPYKFTTLEKVQAFIKGILSGCGFVTVVSANGWPGQAMTARNQYLVSSNDGGGQVSLAGRNTIAMEAVRFITDKDILNLYCIPDKFAQNMVQTQQGFITGMKSLGNLTAYGGMNQRHNKLLCYPYYYNKIKTANGDESSIIPQTHWLNVDLAIPDPRLYLFLRFVGGDTPRIMGSFCMRKNETAAPTDPEFCADWFTIRSYPAIPVNMDASFNQQIQNDIANARQLSALRTNKQIGRQISNPIAQGYTDKVTGTGAGKNNNQSGFQRIAGAIGSGLGTLDQWGKSLGFAGGENGGGLFANQTAVDVASQARTNEAGNIITVTPSVRMGNNFMSQFSVPAFAAYDCGATDSELFVFARYMDEFGAACNCPLNPLNNTGNLWNGRAIVLALNGRTFYKFSNIQVKGVMPNEWMTNIKTLFESGVFLKD